MHALKIINKNCNQYSLPCNPGQLQGEQLLLSRGQGQQRVEVYKVWRLRLCCKDHPGELYVPGDIATMRGVVLLTFLTMMNTGLCLPGCALHTIACHAPAF